MTGRLFPRAHPGTGVSGDVPEDYPPAVAERWESVLADARATAAEYREDDWGALVVHPGDVTPLTDDPFGLDVLAPGDEFATLRDLIEGSTVDRTAVYRAEAGDVRFYVVAAEATGARHAVVVPAFVPLSAIPPLRDRAKADGAMYTHVRPLSGEARVTITHDDPGPFF